MIESARQALAFAEGRENHVCMAYIPEDIDLKTNPGEDYKRQCRFDFAGDFRLPTMPGRKLRSP